MKMKNKANAATRIFLLGIAGLFLNCGSARADHATYTLHCSEGSLKGSSQEGYYCQIEGKKQSTHVPAACKFGFKNVTKDKTDQCCPITGGECEDINCKTVDGIAELANADIKLVVNEGVDQCYVYSKDAYGKPELKKK